MKRNLFIAIVMIALGVFGVYSSLVGNPVQQLANVLFFWK